MDAQQQALAQLCRRYSVRRLSLFGSAARGDPEARDVDLLVDIEAPTPIVYADRYLLLREQLAILFGKPVDLLTEGALKNPYFRRRVETESVVLFEARDSQVPLGRADSRGADSPFRPLAKLRRLSIRRDG